MAAAAAAAQLLTNKQPKQRWSGLFGLRNPQQNQLCELLNIYAKSGVPISHCRYTFDDIDLPAALDYLENIHPCWMEFVCQPYMTDSEIKIQSAIWELVTTEVDYIHALQTVTDVSKNIQCVCVCVCKLCEGVWLRDDESVLEGVNRIYWWWLP